MNTELIYKQVKDCLLEDMDGEVLLYDPKRGKTLHLNSSSATVWQLCDGEHSVADLIAYLQEEFPDAADQIQEDVPEAITKLEKELVIARVDPTE